MIQFLDELNEITDRIQLNIYIIFNLNRRMVLRIADICHMFLKSAISLTEIRILERKSISL